ncbi:uncharacterized protein LOC141849682 [Brevipalpus obovatus]|uniref:uncharacterized protein LOC141849682 n=1 Tax=Brevipalpus obovatus TaxID=246614 RepID=UPI003D9F79F5
MTAVHPPNNPIPSTSSSLSPQSSQSSFSSSTAIFDHDHLLSRYRAKDAIAQRISRMFPEVDETHIHQLLRKHGNRENKVIEVLTIEVTPQLSYQPPIQADEAILNRLTTIFPAVQPSTIKHYLIKHENNEIETIENILNHSMPFEQQKTSSTLGTPRMKLRYINLLYPDVDTTVLFDLLYNCDRNAQCVIEKLDKMGYKRRDLHQYLADIRSKPDYSTHHPKTDPCRTPCLSSPRGRHKLEVLERIQKSYPEMDPCIINMALECSQFDENKARYFLSCSSSCEPEKYLDLRWKTEQSRVKIYPSKSIQTNGFMECSFGDAIIKMKQDDSDETTVTKTHNMGTCTREDGVLIDQIKKRPLAKGPNTDNRKGPNILNAIRSCVLWRGADSLNRKGPQSDNLKGPDGRIEVGSKINACGADPKNRKGPRLWIRKKKLD